MYSAHKYTHLQYLKTIDEKKQCMGKNKSKNYIFKIFITYKRVTLLEHLAGVYYILKYLVAKMFLLKHRRITRL